MRLRVKDVDPRLGELVVRSGKGGHDRVTTLPTSIADTLVRQVERVRAVHERDVADGAGWVDLPGAVTAVDGACAAPWISSEPPRGPAVAFSARPRTRRRARPICRATRLAPTLWCPYPCSG